MRLGNRAHACIVKHKRELRVMFNMLYQYAQVASVRRAAQVWLPSDTAPTTEWFPWVGMFQPPALDSDIARWEGEGGAS